MTTQLYKRCDYTFFLNYKRYNKVFILKKKMCSILWYTFKTITSYRKVIYV
ncbi:hypothetical protein HanXRQr2_Chr09g0401461 [Helianthus annuus]|uniref:Uncharacterized protein n=1 Tax=Helianthus annuus TaxID=4232 RepID=A0A9K3I8G2_HELAN|nr:hypothetical protein HanXRQr2_Chr09g0401461 [Helianthus annuus]